VSAAQIGGIVGAVVGLANFVWLRGLAERLARDGSEAGSRANIIRLVAIADMVVMPVLGYLLGPLVADRI